MKKELGWGNDQTARFAARWGKTTGASPLETSGPKTVKTGEFFQKQNTRRVKSMIRRDGQPITGQMFCFEVKMTN